MARVSKKIARNAATVKEPILAEKVYKTAIYARLSFEDSINRDSGTIENQILLVQKYIEDKCYLKHCGTFIDNGQSGANFERQGFQNLMESIKRGQINCVVVKDLSRFGRDYIETGNYLEKVFPFLGVRFISINDGYDSHNLSNNGNNLINLTVVLKNFINDMYAKDISKKVKSAYEIKQQKGEFLGSCAPYGYIKSPEDRHKLVLDNEVSSVVQDIFQWKLDGMSDTAIVRKLESMQIPSPSNYFYSKSILHHEKYAKKILWNTDSIRNILTNPVYIGNMVQAKEKSRFDYGLKSKKQSRDEWIIVENTHESIIEPNIFYAVRDIIDKRTEQHHKLQEKSKFEENIFAGLIKCADCGKSLMRQSYTSKYGKKYYYFICRSYIKHLSAGCVKKHISENKLKKSVYAVIMQQITLFTNIELSREMLKLLIEKITLYGDKRIEITFNYQDEFEKLQSYIKDIEESGESA